MKPMIIDIIGVPFALGGSKEGPAKGPSALVANELLQFIKALGYSARYVDAKKESVSPEIFDLPATRYGRICSGYAVHEVTKIAGARVFSAHTLGHMPLVLGGDHSISLGTLPQFLDPVFSRGRKVGLLWLDAHYDAHTPKTSHSHYANGLPLASVLGYGDRSLGCYRSSPGTLKQRRLRYLPQNVLHIGAGESDCEPEETKLLAKLGVKRITMGDIHRSGLSITESAIDTFLASVDDVILTFDLDAMRKDYVPGVSFQSKNGMLPWHALSIASALEASGKLRQVEIMEYNPDFEEYTTAGCPLTASFVAIFLEQLFGK